MSPAVEAEEKRLQQQQQQQQCSMGKGVMLEPFVHQVGGSCCLMRLGKQTICKPLIPRELQFYNSLPAGMRRFIPEYRGVVSVSFEEDEDGNLCVFAYPLHSHKASDREREGPPSSCGPKNEPLENDRQSYPPIKDKDKSAFKLQEDVGLDWVQQAELFYSRCSNHNQSNGGPRREHNPWNLKRQQRCLAKMKENTKHDNQYKFILLENLTWRYRMPCVLDLKIGTRHYLDDAPEEKKEKMIRKCQQSTSSSIGVRVSGMQVYHADTGQLLIMNKYHGNHLTLPEFKEALYQFFNSGRHLQHEILTPVLLRLREMQAALEACESYRFYSSSLLIIYDGTHHRGNTDVRLSDEEYEGELLEPEPEPEGLEEEENEEVGGLGFPDSPSISSGISSRCSSPLVDVRMIDFAHATCKHFREDSVVHEGKDSDYILGLQNLITIISELENRD